MIQLINTPVRHKLSALGEGVIVAQDESRITVRFASKELIMSYPGCFIDGFLSTENTEVNEDVKKICVDREKQREQDILKRQQELDNQKEAATKSRKIANATKPIKDTKIALSLKFDRDNPWKDAATKYAVGNIVTGKVARMTDFGAFIELGVGIDALLHVSQIAKEHIEKPADVLSVGQEVTAMVVDYNEESKKISLSIKAILIAEEKKKRAEEKAAAKEAAAEEAEAKEAETDEAAVAEDIETVDVPAEVVEEVAAEAEAAEEAPEVVEEEEAEPAPEPVAEEPVAEEPVEEAEEVPAEEPVEAPAEEPAEPEEAADVAEAEEAVDSAE